MSLASHGHLKPSLVNFLFATRRLRTIAGSLTAPRAPAFKYKPLTKPASCQWTYRSGSNIAAALHAGDGQHSDVAPIVPHSDPVVPQPSSVLRPDHDGINSNIGPPEERWNGESYVDQVTALLCSTFGSGPEDVNARGVVYRKHKEDKQLINQLLKDKGRLSYDWRIPLLLLVQAAASSTENRDLIRDTTLQGPTEVLHRKPLQNYAHFARKVSRPPVWSEATLCQYVADVAGSQSFQKTIPRSLRKSQLNGKLNIVDITTIFDDVFYDDTMEKFLNSDACNTALRFFYTYGMMSKARALYNRMELLRMKIPTATFNIILRGAAQRKDLHNFTFLLQKMLQRGFSPDDDTWLNLLIAVGSGEVRAVIVHKMKEWNVKQTSQTRKAVAALMIPDEVKFYLGSGYSSYTLIHHMDNRYDTGWLTTRAGNSLLHEYGHRRPIGDCLELLVRMKQRGFVPNGITLNTLLRQCLRRGSIWPAIQVLGAFNHHFKLRPGNSEYETLLNLAWDRKSLNVARVIWRSACIDGCVNHAMRKRVYRSLSHHHSRHFQVSEKVDDMEAQSRGQIFCELAGYFVVGVREPQAAELAKLGRAMWASKPDSNKTALTRTGLQIQSDLRTARSCYLKLPFHELLHQALELDLKWKAEGLWKNDERRKLLQGGIQVELCNSQIDQFELSGPRLRWVKTLVNIRKIPYERGLPPSVLGRNTPDSRHQSFG